MLNFNSPENSEIYLFANRTVVICIQHLDLYNGFGGKDAITGSNVEEIIVLLFTVQGLPDRDLPFILDVFDSKLAKWVPSCLVLKRHIPLQNHQQLRGRKAARAIIKTLTKGSVLNLKLHSTKNL